MYPPKQLLSICFDSLCSSPIVFCSSRSNWVFLCSHFPYSFIKPRIIIKMKQSLTDFMGIYANGLMGLYQTLRLFIMCITIGVRVLLCEAVPLKGPFLSLYFVDSSVSKLSGKAFPFLLPLCLEG